MIEIKKKIIKFVSEQLNIKKDKVKTNLNMINLGGDSLDNIELIMNIEDEFKINISEKKFEKLKNLDEIIKYINKKIDVKKCMN